MKLLKTRGDRWCELSVELRDGRLSICGAEGSIVTPRQAKRDAIDYWTSFFEEDRTQLHEMNDRLGTHFRSATAAAKFVLASDGEYHGLDVHATEDRRVFLTESCGQIRETLTAWFPEVAQYFRWHLNDMHAECAHQEARGETYATHPSAVCPDCGYTLGSAWTKRELPAEVIVWASQDGHS